MRTAIAYIFCVVVVTLAAAANLWTIAIPATLGALASVYVCQHRRNGGRRRVMRSPAAR